MYATMRKTNMELKAGTKTVYQTVNVEETTISEEQYKNIVGSMPFFRRLGGSEYATKNYTSKGYLVVRIMSTSPCKTMRTIRTFNFD